MDLYRSVLLSTAALLSVGSTMAQSTGSTAHRPHLLMISVDGMRPDYVTKADEHHLHIPVLRALLAESTYADGVVGVMPTVTYPSHTTLITGVWPNEHGIITNITVDPLHAHGDQWYWYFDAIKVETLYQAASKAGLKTAAVAWPVTVGAPIDYLIAEGAQSELTDTPNGALIHPVDLKQQLHLAQPLNGTKDEKVTAWSVGIIEKYTPNLLLVHLSALDHEEHSFGPFSDEADKQLEIVDKQIGAIVSAEKKIDPDAYVIITSDHGFVSIHHTVALNITFAQNGLIKLGEAKNPEVAPSVLSWDATSWIAGGSSFIVLRDPNDRLLQAKVQELLARLKDDPLYGIKTVYTHDELVRMGGMREASFAVDFRPGFAADNRYSGPIVRDTARELGAHGYAPSNPDVRSAFMLSGPGVAKQRDLGVVDMRQITPTAARLLGVTLKAAELVTLSYEP